MSLNPSSCEQNAPKTFPGQAKRPQGVEKKTISPTRVLRNALLEQFRDLIARGDQREPIAVVSNRMHIPERELRRLIVMMWVERETAYQSVLLTIEDAQRQAEEAAEAVWNEVL